VNEDVVPLDLSEDVVPAVGIDPAKVDEAVALVKRCFDVPAAEARLGNMGGRDHARREDGGDPGARHRQRVRSAQPR
jgi:hypothetical protein